MLEELTEELLLLLEPVCVEWALVLVGTGAAAVVLSSEPAGVGANWAEVWAPKGGSIGLGTLPASRLGADALPKAPKYALSMARGSKFFKSKFSLLTVLGSREKSKG